MRQYQVVCFGELLWDILPSGPLPGGAPMNVAYHLQKLGIAPALITKVGDDDYGKKLSNILSENGVTTDYFQVDKHHQTGLVYASIDHNEIVYDIVFPSAWDFIEWKDEYESLIQAANYFVYGSLTSRHKISGNTLNEMLEIAKTKVLDINLRTPHFQRARIEYLLNKTDVLKLNIFELQIVSQWFRNYIATEDQVKLLQDRFQIPRIIVTKGADGAMVNDKGSFYYHDGFKVTVADTIGSGDAFLAGFLHQLLNNAAVSYVLQFASAMGAFVATQHGACPEYKTEQVVELMSDKAVENNSQKIDQ